MNPQRSWRIFKKIVRKYSTQTEQKPSVTLDESVNKSIDNETYKPRYHPGVIKAKNIKLPESFISAVINTIEDHPIKTLLEDSEKLINHLRYRVPPMEQDELNQKTEQFQKTILKNTEYPENNSEEEWQKYQQRLNDKLKNSLKKKIYNWTPLNYNEYNSLLYLVGRAAPNYAVLYKIISEIKSRDPSFKPRSLFDFGSGIGTGTWAVNEFYKGNIFEYFNVDSSGEMNDLALTLLQDGRGTKKLPFKGVFYRQFLPVSSVPYNLVLSAYTLLELPSLRARLETVQKLWRKTADYLILVEYGSNAGFKVINEARDYILQNQNEKHKGHVFSPCPHDLVCPRFLENETPCNFKVTYQPLTFQRGTEQKTELYSYVVLKKGERNSESPDWPRLVRETLVRSKHSICRMCTKEGQLSEIIFTAKKHGKATYRCAKSTKWGDLLPVSIEPAKKNPDDNSENS